MSADQPLSSRQVVTLLAGTLSRIVHPDLVRDAVSATATQMGLEGVSEALQTIAFKAAAAAQPGSGEGVKRKKRERDQGDAARGPNKISLHTIYMAKASPPPLRGCLTGPHGRHAS